MLGMTKGQEISTFRQFYDNLPDGYLKDILAGLPDYVAKMIVDDTAWPVVNCL